MCVTRGYLCVCVCVCARARDACLRACGHTARALVLRRQHCPFLSPVHRRGQGGVARCVRGGRLAHAPRCLVAEPRCAEFLPAEISELVEGQLETVLALLELGIVSLDEREVPSKDGEPGRLRVRRQGRQETVEGARG